jgi:alkyl hydroperoxide reductase subunit AhpC
MVELGELEGHARQFAERDVRLFVVSNDDLKTARQTQADFPHLRVVSDVDQNLARALEVIHPGAGHDGKDTNAPTTFFLDGAGVVRWLFRPDRFITRLPADDLLRAIERAR